MSARICSASTPAGNMDDEVHIPELLAVLSPERYYRRSTFAPVQSHGDCHAHTFGAYPDRKPRFTVGFDRDGPPLRICCAGTVRALLPDWSR